MSFHTLKFDLKKSFKDNVSKSSVKPASLIKSVASSFGTFGDRVTNSNHRHDEKHEIEADEKREADKEKNRFQSFAPEIENNDVKWFIGGHDYMAAVAQAIEAAEYEVLILDWWLNPELYLIRPGFLHEKWRLDRCLGRAAERGCDIRIIMYKEVEKALVLKSKYSKHTLEALHPNIKVMRHPDHTLLEGMSATLFWAHHEKLLLVDRRKAFVGGIDLCYGRWDLNYHPIADYHPDCQTQRCLLVRSTIMYESRTLTILTNRLMMALTVQSSREWAGTMSPFKSMVLSVSPSKRTLSSAGSFFESSSTSVDQSIFLLNLELFAINLLRSTGL